MSTFWLVFDSDFHFLGRGALRPLELIFNSVSNFGPKEPRSPRGGLKGRKCKTCQTCFTDTWRTFRPRKKKNRPPPPPPAQHPPSAGVHHPASPPRNPPALSIFPNRSTPFFALDSSSLSPPSKQKKILKISETSAKSMRVTRGLLNFSGLRNESRYRNLVARHILRASTSMMTTIGSSQAMRKKDRTSVSNCRGTTHPEAVQGSRLSGPVKAPQLLSASAAAEGQPTTRLFKAVSLSYNGSVRVTPPPQSRSTYPR